MRRYLDQIGERCLAKSIGIQHKAGLQTRMNMLSGNVSEEGLLDLCRSLKHGGTRSSLEGSCRRPERICVIAEAEEEKRLV